jgi:hypothetical protein
MENEKKKKKEENFGNLYYYGVINGLRWMV